MLEPIFPPYLSPRPGTNSHLLLLRTNPLTLKGTAVKLWMLPPLKGLLLNWDLNRVLTPLELVTVMVR